MSSVYCMALDVTARCTIWKVRGDSSGISLIDSLPVIVMSDCCYMSTQTFISSIKESKNFFKICLTMLTLMWSFNKVWINTFSFSMLNFLSFHIERSIWWRVCSEDLCLGNIDVRSYLCWCFCHWDDCLFFIWTWVCRISAKSSAKSGSSNCDHDVHCISFLLFIDDFISGPQSMLKS